MTGFVSWKQRRGSHAISHQQTSQPLIAGRVTDAVSISHEMTAGSSPTIPPHLEGEQ
jgi:hypothetical protein